MYEEQALTRHQICWYLNIKLPSLQKCEQYISIVYKLAVYGILLEQLKYTKTGIGAYKCCCNKHIKLKPALDLSNQ